MKGRLILFTTAYPYGFGESFLDSELPVISPFFNSVIIQPMTFGGSTNTRLVPDNVTIRSPILPESRLLKTVIGIRDLFRHKELRREFFSRRVYSSMRRFRRYLVAVVIISYWKKKCFSVGDATLYFYWGVGVGYLAPIVAWKETITVVRLHGSDVYEYRAKGYLPLREAIFESVGRICPVSEFCMHYFVSKYPQFSEKVGVSRLGTADHGRGLFEPDKQVIVLASCANLIPLKRIDLVVKLLGCEHRNIVWHHFGDGPEMARIRNIAATLPDNISVHLHGRLPNRDVLEFYSRNHVDAFLSVSESEGVPVSIMEAMSFGIPVIATDVGGTSEILYQRGSCLLKEDFRRVDFSSALDVIHEKFCTRQVREEIRSHWFQVASSEKNYTLFAEETLTVGQ